MSMRKEGESTIGKLIIVGSGGFGREVAWLARDALGGGVALQFAVDGAEYLSSEVNGIPVSLLESLAPYDDAVGIVAVADATARRRLASRMQDLGLASTTLVHPGVLRSGRVDIGTGTIICAGCILTTDIRIGKHVHVNLACTVGHDTVIGDFSTLSPGVHVSGNVQLGQGVFVGTGAVIINGTADRPLTIGDGAVIAAGACVIGDVEPGALVAGVPAVRKR